MVFSPLITRTVPHHNKHRGPGPVNRLVIHHWASTSGGDAHLTNPKAAASATYILYGTGELVGQVPEEFRPWTTGPVGDKGSVTVETQDATGAPNWLVSDAAIEKLAQLAADLSNRYNWGPLTRNNVRGHREFGSTECPGPYLYSKLDAIVARANEIRTGVHPAGSVHVVSSGENLSYIAKKYNTSWQALAQLNNLANPDVITPGQRLKVPGRIAEQAANPPRDIAREVYQGKWGNGSDRINRLRAAGFDPLAIQAEVNRRWYT